MEDRSPRRVRPLATHLAHCGLTGNEIARALISMVARSTTRSNQRPDTLMQDRKSARSTKTSCDARPDHTKGSNPALVPLSRHVRLAAVSSPQLGVAIGRRCADSV